MTLRNNKLLGNRLDKLDQKTIFTKVIVLLFIAIAFIITARELNLFYLKLALAPTLVGWIMDSCLCHRETLLKFVSHNYIVSHESNSNMMSFKRTLSKIKDLLLSTTSLFYSTIILSILLILAI